MSAPSFTPLTGAVEGAHVVVFHQSLGFLAATVAEFLAPALMGGGTAIVVGTPEHRALIEDTLAQAGVLGLDAGGLVSLDAEEALSGFMVDGSPDRQRFEATVGRLVRRATATDRPVRVFGEMVAVLWEQGLPEAALTLESLWDEVVAERPFSLLCAYPMSSFRDDASTDGLRRICRGHGRVLPPERVAADA